VKSFSGGTRGKVGLTLRRPPGGGKMGKGTTVCSESAFFGLCPHSGAMNRQWWGGVGGGPARKARGEKWGYCSRSFNGKKQNRDRTKRSRNIEVVVHAWKSPVFTHRRSSQDLETRQNPGYNRTLWQGVVRKKKKAVGKKTPRDASLLHTPSRSGRSAKKGRVVEGLI